MKKILCILIILAVVTSVWAQKTPFTIDDDFPGGNIVVDSISGDRILLHQDLNETVGNWFYWAFRVQGARGKNLTFQFTHPWGKDVQPLNVIGVNGPGMSTDGGKTWTWVGIDQVSGSSFKHQFKEDQNDVRFSFAMPYTTVHLNEFLSRYKDNPNLGVGKLAITSGGRSVERLHLGSIHGNAKYRLVITARHHACEMMTNYVLEGLMRFVLEDETEGRWFRENVEILIIPFVDKDGVEDGDQGKSRVGRDHNRDYSGESIYAETDALRNFIPIWSKDKLVGAVDLHCPYIRGAVHERIHQVGHPVDNVWQEQIKFSSYLENATSGSLLPYYSKNDLKYGQSWNIPSNFSAGKNFTSWITDLKEVKLATILEIPYALSSGKIVDQGSARILGKDLSRALFNYLQGNR